MLGLYTRTFTVRLLVMGEEEEGTCNALLFYSRLITTYVLCVCFKRSSLKVFRFLRSEGIDMTFVTFVYCSFISMVIELLTNAVYFYCYLLNIVITCLQSNTYYRTAYQVEIYRNCLFPLEQCFSTFFKTRLP